MAKRQIKIKKGEDRLHGYEDALTIYACMLLFQLYYDDIVAGYFADKKDKYYRVCLNKKCKLKFRANHMARKFCCNKCKDGYHVLKRRLKKKKQLSNSKANG